MSIPESTDVLEQLTEVLVERLHVDRALIKPEAHVFDDLELDSVDLLSAVAVLEERFDIEVPDEDLEHMLTVSSAVETILAKVKARDA